MILQRRTPRNGRGQQHSSSTSLPAPTGGLNAVSSEAEMPVTDAIAMENWLPGQADVAVRKGATSFATGLAASPKTLLTYTSPSTTKLFAASDLGLQDATAGGVLGASLHAITSGVLSYVNFNTLGGAYIVAVNGVDRLSLYNGTTWSFIDSFSSPAISGIATTEFAAVSVHKRRLWFVQRASTSAWYLPVNQLGGTAVEFQLGQLFTRGGSLLAIVSWTMDGGTGLDDYIVFISSEGELAVYSGSNPADANDFALVGVYALAPLLGPRCAVKFGGDLLLLTTEGLIPLSRGLASGEIAKSEAITTKIDPLLGKAVKLYREQEGWALHIDPINSLLFVNVPTASFATSKQYVMNTLTGAWTTFTGWDVLCFANFDRQLMFAKSSLIAKGLDGKSDFGNNIRAFAQQAYSYLNSRGRQKHFKLIRPVLRVDQAVEIGLGLNIDYQPSNSLSTIPYGVVTGGVWDSGTWDSSVWGFDLETKREWRTVAAREGYCASVKLYIETKSATVLWSSTDFVYGLGKIL